MELEPTLHSEFTNKELKRPGVYRVKYMPDGDIYVGCSVKLFNRLARYTKAHHTSSAGPWMDRKAMRLMGYKDPLPRFGIHINPCWYIHIRENIEVGILEFAPLNCSKAELEEIEDKWIRRLNPQMNGRGESMIISRNPWIEIRLSELEAQK